jgi:Skp family chaperone for outer membrane proteins
MFGGVAQAQNPPAAPSTPAQKSAPPNPGTKFGAIDFRSALLDSDPGKAAVAEIEKGLGPLKTDFDKLQKEYADLQTKLQAAKTDADRAPILREIDEKSTVVKRTQEDAQRKSEDLQEKYLPPVAILINKIIDEYAREAGLAIVFDPRSEPSNIIFVNVASDITTEIIRRLNNAYEKDPKSIAPAPGAASAVPPLPKPQ